MVYKGKGSQPKPKEETGSVPYVEKSPSVKCGKKYEGKCLVFRGNCYGC